MKILKFILKLFGGLVALSIVLGIIASNWEGIVFQYNKLFWEPNTTSLAGISLGESRSDILFKKGMPTRECGEDGDYCIWAAVDRFGNPPISNGRDDISIRFDKDIVRRIGDFSPSLLFKTVEEMQAILGEEDIRATQNFRTRLYTYLRWSVSYEFIQNRIRAAYLWEEGLIGFASYTGGTEELVIQGRIVCPSDDCPYDDEGEIKPEYEDKNYEVFLHE